MVLTYVKCGIIIYLCTETQHYCLLTGGAVKIKSGPLWF